MSWMQKLVETYDNCISLVGCETSDGSVPLLPVYHTTHMAHIQVVIDEKGSFRGASLIPKREARTIVPCTERSARRSGDVSPHPLCDKLQYVALDYPMFVGCWDARSTAYISNLEKWCCSSFLHPKAVAVLKYVKQGTLIRDLVDNHILAVDETGKLLKQWERQENLADQPITEMKVSQEGAFVRWVVEIPGDLEPRVWRDRTLWDCWIAYYRSTRRLKGFCYVTGAEQLLAESHPAKIRHDGDKAKLISSNDRQGFTFRGRFLTDDQAVTVGLDVTQKAHHALRWLISRQGYRQDDLAIVAWATSGARVPQPTEDFLSILELENMPGRLSTCGSTAQEVAIKLKRMIAGYKKKLGNTSMVVVMAVKSATIGRISVVYYQELTGSDFLQRINDWHVSCAWLHHYRSSAFIPQKGQKTTKGWPVFVGAPAPVDIVEAAYGQKEDDKLKEAIILRILPCIMGERQLPRNLVESAVRRACNRMGMEDWQWNKTLSIACALFKKYNGRGNYDMALDPNRKTRDYLYGRLLALAESLERWALSKASEKRETNAARLMQRFAEHPFSTWRTIELALGPYKARLGHRANQRQRMIDEVLALFDVNDFLSDKRLSGEFLLGYHCQREYLYNSSSVKGEADEDQNQE